MAAFVWGGLLPPAIPAAGVGARVPSLRRPILRPGVSRWHNKPVVLDAVNWPVLKCPQLAGFEVSPEDNEFTGGNFVLNQPPVPIAIRVGDELEDHFDTDTVRWLERKGLMVKPDLVRRVVDSIKMFHAGLAEEDA